MCAILDNIYREHFNEPGFDRVAQLNFPFHERVFEADVETGEESGSGRVNLETAEDQRLAAEEYVASIAESGAPKPNWWKEFLQSVRMWIADRFPHARQVRMTDREIETLLARSARAARRNRRGNGKVRFSVDQHAAASIVHVPKLDIDLKDTRAVKDFLHQYFKGREIEIKSDGRLVLITSRGLNDSLKNRGEHRKSYAALDRIIENSYFANYVPVDNQPKHSHLNGQYVYVSALEIDSKLYSATIKLDDPKTGNRAHYKGITVKKTGRCSVRKLKRKVHRVLASRIFQFNQCGKTYSLCQPGWTAGFHHNRKRGGRQTFRSSG